MKKLKLAKFLNIKGATIDQEQLENYIEKIASEHILQKNSNKDTYPIPNLIEDYKFILETYNLLNKHLKLGIKMHSAGEWLLDNFYVIEETVKSIEKELSLKKYQKMIGLSSGPYNGFARCYVLAEEIVAFSPGATSFGRRHSDMAEFRIGDEISYIITLYEDVHAKV